MGGWIIFFLWLVWPGALPQTWVAYLGTDLTLLLWWLSVIIFIPIGIIAFDWTDRGKYQG